MKTHEQLGKMKQWEPNMRLLNGPEMWPTLTFCAFSSNPQCYPKHCTFSLTPLFLPLSSFFTFPSGRYLHMQRILSRIAETARASQQEHHCKEIVKLEGQATKAPSEERCLHFNSKCTACDGRLQRRKSKNDHKKAHASNCIPSCAVAAFLPARPMP